MKLFKALILLIGCLQAGSLWAHVLELPQKLAMSYETWLATSQSLYKYFAYAGVPIEISLVLLTALLTYLWRRSSRAPLYLFSAASLTFSLGIFFLFVQPADKQIAQMLLGSAPQNWMHWRLQWEGAQAMRFALTVCAFMAMVWSMMQDERAGEGAEREPVSIERKQLERAA